MGNARKLVAGNWKMNGTRAQLAALLEALKTRLADHLPACEVAVCPPFTLLAAADLTGSAIALGAQDCAAVKEGAYTGDISATMLKEAGCAYAIVGHSERRAGHAETDALVAAKAKAVIEGGLRAIICVGETDVDMAEAARLQLVGKQLQASLPANATADNCVIAYEPVWAIGSGKTPTTEQITAMHQTLAKALPAAMQGARILYGGSVKADNAKAILALPGVDGALVGGASLQADSFMAIVAAAQ